MGVLSRLNGRCFYLDANVFIYALNGFSPFDALLKDLFGAIESGSIQAVTSELTAAEILIIPFRNGNIEEESRCRMILRKRPGLDLAPVTFEILEEVARLRAANANLRTPDAIHLATALRAGCDSYLSNDQRISGIKGLNLILLSDLV
jgi:predicted nucleic acid-binding protein